MNDLKACLAYINPANLSYQEWVNVGMALKYEGCPCFITGVISQYDKSKGWHYSLELQDRKARCVYRVALKDVEVDRNA